MKYIILGHENPDVDSLVSGYILEKVMKKRGYDVSFCIPDKAIALDSEKICNKYNLYLGKYYVDELPSDAKYILVDHNDRDVPGKIVAVLDHHPTPKDKSSIPYYRNEKASATACLIARDCEEELDKHEIELAADATFVDTVSFHSSKTVRDDISWVNEMTTKYDLDYDEMYRDGLCLTELTDVEEIAFNGLKKAQYEDLSIHSSYVQIVDLEKNKDIIDGIVERLRTYREEENIDLFVFIVYDMTNFYTKVYKIGEEIELAEYFLYASRGNTIIPDILKQYGKKGMKR